MSGSITSPPDQERCSAARRDAPVPDTEPKFNWRDHLKVHPLAEAYPKVPHERLVEIGESIRRNGLKFPIGIHAQGDPGTEVFELLDGVTRLNSMAAVGIKFEIKRFRFGRRLLLDLVIHDVPGSLTTQIFYNMSGDEIADEIEMANLHRRHLEPEQYRARVEASHARIKAALERDPDKSDRAHAEELRVSKDTVRRVRATGAPAPVEGKRIGKDGKARKQPATKPAKSGSETKNGDDSSATSAEARKNAHAALEVAVGAGEQRDQPAPGESGQHDPHGDHDNHAVPSAKPLDDWTTEDRVTVRELTLQDYFRTANGADIFSRMAGRDEKLASFLRAIPLKTVIAVLGEELRAALPANPLLKLRGMDTTAAAETLAEAFGTARFEKIIAKVHELRTAGGKSGTSKPGRPFKRTLAFEKTAIDESGNLVFAQPRGSRIRH